MNALLKFEIPATWNYKLVITANWKTWCLRFLIRRLSRASLVWKLTGDWDLPYQSLTMARMINLKNIWLFLSTRSLGNSSTSKDNHTKWIGEELHVFSTPPSRSFKRRISRSPPTNVARVRILASTPYVGWVCCWFSPLLREVFLRVLRFSPLLKN